MRVVVTLACTECGDRNYTTTKNREIIQNEWNYRKYCLRLRNYTIHRETR
ncbi:50S ribosomal protein L33 [Paenibacillus sp. CAA11]|nr:50S ribosomal protein L33 [Paenibacillus sp. CAA11]